MKKKELEEKIKELRRALSLMTGLLSNSIYYCEESEEIVDVRNGRTCLKTDYKKPNWMNYDRT